MNSRYHTSGKSIAEELRRIAGLVEGLSEIGETLLQVEFQINSGDVSAAAHVDRIHGLFFDSDPDYSRTGIYATSWRDQTSDIRTWINAYALCPPPQRIVDAAYDEANAEDDQILDAHLYDYFGGDWERLDDVERDRLLELCRIAGWSGDWRAAYVNVVGPAPRTAPPEETQINFNLGPDAPAPDDLAPEPEEFIAAAIATETCADCEDNPALQNCSAHLGSHREPEPGPELAMYDNVYAGWPTNRRAGVGRL